MLCEHTLLTSGDVADANSVYSGWPAKQVDDNWEPKFNDDEPAGLVCPMCRGFPKDTTSTSCGHIFCKSYAIYLSLSPSFPDAISSQMYH